MSQLPALSLRTTQINANNPVSGKPKQRLDSQVCHRPTLKTKTSQKSDSLTVGHLVKSFVAKWIHLEALAV